MHILAARRERQDRANVSILTIFRQGFDCLEAAQIVFSGETVFVPVLWG